jgi:L-glyceraldehyde 3-phosphate reductase
MATANASEMEFRTSGRSGLRLPAISLGLWHNFGSVDSFENARAIARRAFDVGITHFDLANNYGPEPGSAEETFGRVLRLDFVHRRDELVISTKAGYRMWPGPYGDGGSRKYLVTSLDQSLRRLGVEYVDVYYHHRPDPATPLEESMGALAHVVAQGKALYVGLSNYDAQRTRQAVALLREMRVPCVLHQPKYSMLVRESRVGAVRRPARRRRGVHCLLATRPGFADVALFTRHARRLSRGKGARLSQAGGGHRSLAHDAPSPRRDRA